MGDAAKKSVPLQRGTACLVCRKRKVKCDALRPQCTPCAKAFDLYTNFSGVSKPSPCIYDRPKDDFISPNTEAGLDPGPSRIGFDHDRDRRDPSRLFFPSQNAGRNHSWYSETSMEQAWGEDSAGERQERESSADSVSSIVCETTYSIRQDFQPSSSSRLQAQVPKSTSPVSIEGVKNLIDAFFKHCLISSVVSVDVFERAISGDEQQQSVLRAVLANAVFYCSLEDANLSLWSNETTRCDSIQAVSTLHSSASRRSMVSRELDDQQRMEQSLPIHLLLASSGLKTSSDHRVLSDLSAASISIRRLGMYATPSIESSPRSDQRDAIFWAFIVLDRQIQVQLSIYPPLLSDSYISVPLSRERTGVMSISSAVLNPSFEEELWNLIVQVHQVFGQIIGRRQVSEAPDASQDQNDRWAIQRELEVLQAKVKTLNSSLVKGKSTSSNLSEASDHSYHLKLNLCKTVIQTSYIVFQYASGTLPDSEKLLHARLTAEDAESLVPSDFKLVDSVVATCWLINGRFLLRELSRMSTETEKGEARSHLFRMAFSLFSWGETYPRGNQLLKSLVALCRLSTSTPAFLHPPVHLPPEAKFVVGRSPNQSLVSLDELGRRISDDEIRSMIRQGREDCFR